MSVLRKRMQEDLELRGYSKSTRGNYFSCCRQLAKYYMRSPQDLSLEEIRKFLLHLINDRKISSSHHKMFIASFKFLYGVTLGRGDMAAMLVYPKVRNKLPDVLSVEEVAKLLKAVSDPIHRMIIITIYSLGLRIGESCRLKVHDIDSQRMVIHIREAKHGRERFVMLPENLLKALRSYWQLVRPSGPYLFPGTAPGSHLDPQAVRASLRHAALQTQIYKRVTPHVLRHSFATYLLDGGTDIRTIQAILGHSSIVTTGRYTRVSTQKLSRVTTPYGELTSIH